MTLTPWQRSTILSAINYLKERARGGQDGRAEVLAQGLAEVLEPGRRVVRMQREAAQAAASGAAAGHDRRTLSDRRRPTADRRQKQVPIAFPDRRMVPDRRSGRRRG